MTDSIFVNLPVADLDRSMNFFRELGFSFNAQFTDHKAACLVVADGIYVMLLERTFFQTFTDKPVADAFASTEVLTCLGCTSRDELHRLVDTACQHGGRENGELQDHGFMIQRSFEDLDGHIWELVYIEDNQ